MIIILSQLNKILIVSNWLFLSFLLRTKKTEFSGFCHILYMKIAQEYQSVSNCTKVWFKIRMKIYTHKKSVKCIYLCNLPLCKSSKKLFNLPGEYMSLTLGNRYMWRNESIAINGKSLWLFPKWCSGWANRLPSAVRKLIFSRKRKKKKNVNYKTCNFITNNKYTFFWDQLSFNDRLVILYCFQVFGRVE